MTSNYFYKVSNVLWSLLFCTTAFAEIRTHYQDGLCQTFFRQYLEIRFADVVKILENSEPENWPFDGHSSPSYENSFGAFWSSGEFLKHLGNRRKENKFNHILDLMGSAVFVWPRHKEIDSLTGLRVRHLSEDRLPPGFPSPKWKEYEGNLYSRHSWHLLRARLSELKTNYFDLIIARPAGGLFVRAAGEKGIPLKYKALADLMLIRRAYELLSPDGGEIFFEYERLPGGEMKEWLLQLKDAGIKFDISERPGPMLPTMMILKTPDSPKQLPIL